MDFEALPPFERYQHYVSAQKQMANIRSQMSQYTSAFEREYMYAREQNKKLIAMMWTVLNRKTTQECEMLEGRVLELENKERMQQETLTELEGRLTKMGM